MGRQVVVDGVRVERPLSWIVRFARAAFAAFVTLSATVVRADEPSLDIAWDAPAGCPTLDDVRGYLDAVVPEDVRARLEGTRATIVLRATADGFVGDVRVERGAFVGERSVDGRRCDDVARSAIIVVSVALTDAVNATPDPVATEPVVSPVEPTVPDPGPDRFALGVDLGIVSGFGSGAVAPRLSVLARYDRSESWTVGVRVRSIVAGRIDAGSTIGRASSIGIAPDVCARIRIGSSIRLSGCVLVEAGLVRARGRSLASTETGVAGFVVVGIEPAIEFGDRIRLRIALDGEARLVRPRFVVSGDGTVERTSVLAGGARLGLLFTIP